MAEMRAMIGSAIDMARHDPTRMDVVPLSLGNLIRSVVQPDVVLSVNETLWVKADAVALRRMLNNLLDNARRYGGNATISCFACNELAVIEVSGDGPGIDPEILPHVFDMFARGVPSRNQETGGSGLGLTIVRTIAEAHDLKMMERRRALVLLGSAGTVSLLSACGGGGTGTTTGGTSSSGSSSGSTSTTRSTSSTSSTSGGTGGSCVQFAAETGGPFPADGTNSSSGPTSNALASTGIVRSDIRSSFIGSTTVAGGVRVDITFTVVNVNASCAPLARLCSLPLSLQPRRALLAL